MERIREVFMGHLPGPVGSGRGTCLWKTWKSGFVKPRGPGTAPARDDGNTTSGSQFTSGKTAIGLKAACRQRNASGVAIALRTRFALDEHQARGGQNVHRWPRKE